MDGLDLKRKKQSQKQEMVAMICDMTSNRELLRQWHERHPNPEDRRTRQWVQTIKNKIKSCQNPSIITRTNEKKKEKRILLFGEIKQHLRTHPEATLTELAAKTDYSVSHISSVLKEFGYKKVNAQQTRKKRREYAEE